MNIPRQNINSLWSYLIIEELIRQGIDYFCISPGSRSTPLTTAVARHPRARSFIIYDERSAAFHALGYARATGRPAVLICTSGTAPANYLPAVIEASQENLPLIIISADRPPELRDSGANQTIDQIKLFGSYVRHFFDMPPPEQTFSPRFVLSRIDRLIDKAFGPPAGPVHLNCMFREPLAPQGKPVPASYLIGIDAWLNSMEPLVRLTHGNAALNQETDRLLTSILKHSKKGMIIVGELESGRIPKDLAYCLARLGWPVFADITSGLRLGFDWPGFIAHFDLLLAAQISRFDTIVQLGGRYVSKRLLQFLQKHPPRNHLRISVSDHWIDPAGTVTHHLRLSIASFCSFLNASNLFRSSSHASLLRRKSEAVEQYLRQTIDNAPLNQPAVSRLVAQLLPEGHGLFLANSLAVREMDMYAQRPSRPIFVAANRGASGIDGNISTAAGFAVGLKRPVTLIIGDLAFLHDLNALSFVSRLPYPLIIVLINNGGGAIFHYLPIAKFEDIFEPYFATPHRFTFEKTAQQFGLNYAQPTSLEAFTDFYQEALKTALPTLIEINTDRRDNYERYQKILVKIRNGMG